MNSLLSCPICRMFVRLRRLVHRTQTQLRPCLAHHLRKSNSRRFIVTSDANPLIPKIGYETQHFLGAVHQRIISLRWQWDCPAHASTFVHNNEDCEEVLVTNLLRHKLKIFTSYIDIKEVKGNDWGPTFSIMSLVFLSMGITSRPAARAVATPFLEGNMSKFVFSSLRICRLLRYWFSSWLLFMRFCCMLQCHGILKSSLLRVRHQSSVENVLGA